MPEVRADDHLCPPADMATTLVLSATPPIAPAYEAAMQRQQYAVIDVEVTEGDPTRGRVMEVAVIALDGSRERLRWDSLVQPRERVPWFTRKLTGIDDDLLRHAPCFHEIASTLATLTQDRIVVAHNVRFDMTALRHEFARVGLPYERATICTERVGRRLMPALEHYNLTSLCRHLGIHFPKAHRALADAEATAELLKRMIQEFGSDAVLGGLLPERVAKRA